jgi:hypothetical protein
VLRELQKISGESEYVFPNIQKPSGSISENTLLYALLHPARTSQTSDVRAGAPA